MSSRPVVFSTPDLQPIFQLRGGVTVEYGEVDVLDGTLDGEIYDIFGIPCLVVQDHVRCSPHGDPADGLDSVPPEL